MVQKLENCTGCPFSDPSREKEGQMMHRGKIQSLIEVVNVYLKRCAKYEERWRTEGITYHKSRHEVRQFQQLKRHYEAKEGKGFTDVDPVIQDLTKLLVALTHVPSRASAHELYHKIHYEFQPAVNAVRDMVKECGKTIKLITEEVHETQVETHYLQRQEGNVDDWWGSTFDDYTEEFTLDTDAPEWDIFRHWVMTLPEAGLSLANGMDMDKFAMNLLWVDKDEFID
ncbi:hypothetical protein CFE70_000353 [Pyrenophora teres f. teres 0-1]|uniref:Uncharacterized protein n=2 Tax=Pyrenophora teres f. teres TaxID=97479 RepID=E3REW0_PYRTT|nr:hypothetical protein PTT_05148 [Pyrenophora teres f. teres 0-1]KAE8837644.1 hypothetical protein PTNB85_04979 [Pyrenophora teres f. teres]KAE8839936.1 hypothetical protein HRS9122_06541 [Pyrenophora teres f. teres]KAE8862467.1 hypothetical protein PTNB29_05029 [Pyrenophora teres f. teres]KAE8869294.1 hypothetical protein PTNB73_04347 [Pyrenophora teres f. teres]